MDQELAALASQIDREHFAHPRIDTAEDGQVIVRCPDLRTGEKL